MHVATARNWLNNGTCKGRFQRTSDGFMPGEEDYARCREQGFRNTGQTLARFGRARVKPVEGAVEVPVVSGGCLNEGLYSADVGLGAGHVKVVHPLEVQPEVGSRPQGLSDSQGRVRRDGPATVDDVMALLLVVVGEGCLRSPLRPGPSRQNRRATGRLLGC